MIFPLVQVPFWLMIVLNVILWPIFHMIISLLTVRIPDQAFLRDQFVLPVKATPQGQHFYEHVLFIRVWKKFIPDGATIFKFGFRKKTMEGNDQSYFNKFILETRRAEFSHVLQMLPMFIFFIFNTWEIAMIMVVYALAFNLPLILLQRYNRIRFLRIIQSR